MSVCNGRWCFSHSLNRTHPESPWVNKIPFLCGCVGSIHIYFQSFNLNSSAENHRKFNQTKIQLRLFFDSPHIFTHFITMRNARFLPHSSSPPVPTNSAGKYLSVFALYYMRTVSNNSTELMYYTIYLSIIWSILFTCIL